LREVETLPHAATAQQQPCRIRVTQGSEKSRVVDRDRDA
jgi:hypothetical protein